MTYTNQEDCDVERSRSPSPPVYPGINSASPPVYFDAMTDVLLMKGIVAG